MVTSSIYCNSFRLKAGILFMVSYIPTFFKKMLLEEHLSVLIKCI